MSPRFCIEPMLMQHVTAVAAIEAQITSHGWNQQQFTESLMHQHCYVLLLEEQVAGYLIFSTVGDESELFNIAVTPNQQGMGLGKLLMDFYLQQLGDVITQLFLEVRCSNQPAIELYKKWGFTEAGRRKNYYRCDSGSAEREDALIMTRSLD